MVVVLEAKGRSRSRRMKGKRHYRISNKRNEEEMEKEERLVHFKLGVDVDVV
jgi:hypothetical protein